MRTSLELENAFPTPQIRPGGIPCRVDWGDSTIDGIVVREEHDRLGWRCSLLDDIAPKTSIKVQSTSEAGVVVERGDRRCATQGMSDNYWFAAFVL